MRLLAICLCLLGSHAFAISGVPAKKQAEIYLKLVTTSTAAELHKLGGPSMLMKDMVDNMSPEERGEFCNEIIDLIKSSWAPLSPEPVQATKQLRAQRVFANSALRAFDIALPYSDQDQRDLKNEIFQRAAAEWGILDVELAKLSPKSQLKGLPTDLGDLSIAATVKEFSVDLKQENKAPSRIQLPKIVKQVAGACGLTISFIIGLGIPK